MTILRWSLVLAVILPAGCGKSSGGGSGGTGEPPKVPDRAAPFQIAIHKVERLPEIRAFEKARPKVPAAGNVFLCVQHEDKNVGSAPEHLPSPRVVDGKGTKVEISAATASYLVDDWKPDSAIADIAPGAAVKRADCYEVADAGVSGAKLTFEHDDRYGKGSWTAAQPLALTSP